MKVLSKMLSVMLGLSLTQMALAAPNPNELTVGAFFPMSGGTATYGQESVKGIKLALDQINKEGIKGKKMNVLFEDDKGEPVEAANAVQKLINVDKVTAVLGSVQSSNTLAAAPIAQKSKVPLMTPASTNITVTETGDYISRICFTDDFQGAIMAKFAKNSLKKGNAAVIIDSSSDYSKGLAKAFKEKFVAMGGKVIAEEYAYQQKDTDFRSLLKKVKRAGPDVVFLPGYYTEVGLILRQADELKIDVPFLGGDGWDSPNLADLAGAEALKGNYMTSHFSAEDTDPLVQKFVKEYEGRYNERPGAMAALGYDSALVLADALKRAKNLTAEGVKAAINSTKNFNGVTGKITLDVKRNAIKSIVVLETNADGGKFKEKIAP